MPPKKSTPSELLQLINQVRKQKLTYLSEKRLCALAEQVSRIEDEGVPGILIEAGCALGGSGIVLCAAKDPSRPLIIHDVFGMIPAPSEEDEDDAQNRYRIISSGESKGIGGDVYYGYEQDLYAKVIQNFENFGYPPDKYNVTLKRGLLQDTLRINVPVAFAHIDVDWYDPVKCCLERIEPQLSPGSSIIIDDYKDWSGCKKAVDGFLERKNCLDKDDSGDSLLLIRPSSQLPSSKSMQETKAKSWWRFWQ